MSLNLVIFDCDGTLVDSQHMIVAAMERAFTGSGLAPPPRRNIKRVVGLSLDLAVGRLLPKDKQDIAYKVADDYKAAFAGLRAEAAHEEPLFPGIRDALLTLAKRDDVVLAMATGKSVRGVKAVIEREALHGLFQSIETADTHPSKPDPSMVLAAMARAGAQGERTVVVGDTSYDMEMARRAGAGALGVAWGYHEIDELVEAGAHAVVEEGSGLLVAIDDLLRQLAA